MFDNQELSKSYASIPAVTNVSSGSKQTSIRVPWSQRLWKKTTVKMLTGRLQPTPRKSAVL
jgi:hypothetical protein